MIAALDTAAVVDEIETYLPLLVGDTRQRHDLARVDDGRIEAGLHALVEEHAVERVACRGGEPERHVRHAERGEHAGEFGLDAADGVHRGDAIATQVVAARRQRERQRVEDQVARLESVAIDGQVVDAMGDA